MARIDRTIVKAEFIMKMRPCRASGRAYQADDLITRNRVADLYIDLR